MQIAFATVYRNKRPNLPASLPQPLEKLVKVLSTAAVSIARAGEATPYYPLPTTHCLLLTTCCSLLTKVCWEGDPLLLTTHLGVLGGRP